MVPNRMTGGYHSCHQITLIDSMLAEQKKGCPKLILFTQIENLRRKDRMWPIVEG
jgi:hypothetical protein